MGHLSAQIISFNDNFEDGIIDASKWFQVSGSGTVTESEGYLKLDYRSGSPPHEQIRTKYDLIQEDVTITIRINPVYIAGDKNIGFWLGDINTGSVTGFQGQFHSTQNYSFYIAKYYHYDGWTGAVPMTEGTSKVWTNSSDFYAVHEVVITKEGGTHTFYVDGEQIVRDTDQTTQPTSLYFSLGRPWMEKKDINVNIQDGVLTISGEKKSDVVDNSDHYYCSETSYGTFSRSFRLPDEVEEKKIKANYKNGVMNCTMCIR